jgi:hypothetical protein
MQIKQPYISLENIRFPRELETDKTVEIIRQALLADTCLLRSESDFAVPRIEMNRAVQMALQRARRQRRIRCGFDAVAGILENEKTGIENIYRHSNIPNESRISRLLLFSNDAAPRLYRHVEQLLIIHAPRLLGCLLDTGSEALGYLINNRESQIKVIMVEKKVSVCEVLRTLINKPNAD